MHQHEGVLEKEDIPTYLPTYLPDVIAPFSQLDFVVWLPKLALDQRQDAWPLRLPWLDRRHHVELLSYKQWP